MLQAVIEHGGFAQASEALFKSQSTISYAVNKLQQQLGLEILTIKGRKAELTEAGKVMLRRSGDLLKEAEALEKVAGSLAEGWEGSLTLAVDVIFPPEILSRFLQKFSPICPHTRFELVETVLSGTTDMLISGQADMVISGHVPQGFLGEPLMEVPFIPVARFDHPLLMHDQPLNQNDLKSHRQIVIRDSGLKKIDAGWLGAEERWTVSHISTSIRMVAEGLGFAWLPAYHIEEGLKSGILKPLTITPKHDRQITVYLVYADADCAGPAVKALGKIIRDSCIDQIQEPAGITTISGISPT